MQRAKEHAAWLGSYALALSPEPLHIEWGNLSEAHARLNVFAPTESGKSTFFTVLTPLHELGRNPDLRIGLISSTHEQAVKWLAQIKANIELNDRLHDVWPGLVPEDRQGYPQAWKDDRIFVRRSGRAVFREKDYSIQALGKGGPLLASRLDLIILDDWLDFESTRTPAPRQKDWEWLRSPGGPISRLTPNGRIRMVGTAWHEDDAAHRVEREMPTFKVVRYRMGTPPCILPWWTDERLAERRSELGEIEFARQMLNIAFGEATGYLPITAVRRCQELCDDPPGYWMGEVAREDLRWCTAGVDVGGSTEPGSALASIAVLGLGQDGFKRPLHIRSGLWVGVPLFVEIVQVWMMFEHVLREQIVESNAQQAHLTALLSDEAIVQAVAGKLGLAPEVAKRIASKIAGSTYGLYTTKLAHREDVRWGIRGMGPEMEALKWRFPKGQPEIEELFEQIRKYDPAGHPGDRLVAVYLANAKMLGKGTPMRNMARSRSVHEIA